MPALRTSRLLRLSWLMLRSSNRARSHILWAVLLTKTAYPVVTKNKDKMPAEMAVASTTYMVTRRTKDRKTIDKRLKSLKSLSLIKKCSRRPTICSTLKIRMKRAPLMSFCSLKACEIAMPWLPASTRITTKMQHFYKSTSYKSTIVVTFSRS